LRSNSDQSRDSRVVLPLAHFLIGMLDPERLKRLVAENVVPVVGLRSADAFQGLFPIICISGLISKFFGSPSPCPGPPFIPLRSAFQPPLP
jgi:hypothetical protein